MAIRYKVDNARGVIVENFEKRGWIRADSEEGVHVVRQIFSLDSGIRLSDTQLINHFPNHSELTRKDLMYKNIKRYRRDLEKERNPLAEKDERGIYTMLDFVPNTFSLPSDYAMFVEEYKRRPNSVWIMKPTNRAQGVGIFLIHKISQIKKWSRSDKWVGPPGMGGAAQGSQANSSGMNYIVQRYIDNPLLVGGKKFDLRMYVLVTSYRPLKAYMFKQGFGRFCAEEYNDDLDSLDNEMAHLTNNVMTNDKHCFECYGYDVLIDDTLRPWLIEVNASPSLSATTRSDRAMKLSLINDVLEIVVPPNLLDPARGVAPKDYAVPARRLGHFEVLYDEAAELELDMQDGQTSLRGRGAASLPPSGRPGTAPMPGQAGSGAQQGPHWVPSAVGRGGAGRR